MPKMMQISEAASLALHSMALLASRPKKVFSVREIATTLNGSEAHLSKVLQRLARGGLVRSSRGPKGGFELGKAGEKITLLDVYEVIDGHLSPSECLLSTPLCVGDSCIFGHLLEDVDKHFREYLRTTKLTDVIQCLRRT